MLESIIGFIKYIFYCKTKINLDLSGHPIYVLSINDEID